MILDISGIMLKRLGYNVFKADSCELAYRIVEEQQGTIDLAILDYGMEGSNGQSVPQHLKRLDPDLKILISSGYDEPGPISNLLKEIGGCFLQKPFSLTQLKEKISVSLS
jgi:two-component system cell cycle sensor histidine kinase/response regulator CckA